MISSRDTLLEDLQADIAARLAADSELGGLNIVTERVGNVLSEVNRALGLVKSTAGNRGLCLVVLQPTGNPETLELPGPLLNLLLAVRVMERPVANNTGVTALTVVRRVLRILHHYTPGGLTSCLLAGTPAIEPVADPIADVAYDVLLTCRESEYERDERAARPSIEYTGTDYPFTVTLSCITANSVIWYTLDGSHPSPRGSTSVQYDAPFTVNAPCHLRAVAYAPDLIASDSASARFL